MNTKLLALPHQRNHNAHRSLTFLRLPIHRSRQEMQSEAILSVSRVQPMVNTVQSIRHCQARASIRPLAVQLHEAILVSCVYTDPELPPLSSDFTQDPILFHAKRGIWPTMPCRRASQIPMQRPCNVHAPSVPQTCVILSRVFRRREREKERERERVKQKVMQPR